MFRLMRPIILFILLIGIAETALADSSEWEYKVVILQGITAGGTIKKEESGIYIDTKRTKTLNDLASEGWEVVTVIGALGADHVVYLRREISR